MKAHSFKGTWFSSGQLSICPINEKCTSLTNTPRLCPQTYVPDCEHTATAQQESSLSSFALSQSSVTVREGTRDPSRSSLIEADRKFICIFHSQMPFLIERGSGSHAYKAKHLQESSALKGQEKSSISP